MSKSVPAIVAICLILMSWGGTASYASGDSAIFEGVGEYVLRNTEVGSDLVGRMTGIASDEVTDAAYRSFVQRIGWQQSAELREELAQDLGRIRSDFEAYRQSKGRSPRLAEGEALQSDEIDFLRNASNGLRSNRIDNLLTESLAFVDVRPAGGAGGGTFTDNARAFIEGGDGETNPAAPTPGEGEVPALPTASAAAPAPAVGDAAPVLDLESMRLRWWQKVAMRFRAYRGFFRAFQMAEGEWRSLFRMGGRQFTANDLAVIRKYNRLLDGLNEYARMRLVVKAFAQERPAIYSRLNEMTADATRQYLGGEISAERYIELRKTAGKDLQLNDIVWEAERRMLNTLERCRDLAGRQMGDRFQPGPISIAEDNIRAYRGNIERITQALRDNGARVRTLQGQLAAAAGDARAGVQSQIDALQHQILRDTADKDLWRSRLDTEATNLEGMYAEFTENYDHLELFANLRNGHINSEEVMRFDMPDAFVAQPTELQSWGDLSDRALYNSTHQLVIDESRLFFRTQVGSTRQFVREMNQMTERYFGKRFTDTALGQEFQQYSQHMAQVIATRLFKVVGLPTAATLGAEYGPRLAQRLWNYVFQDHGSPAPAAGGDHSGGSGDDGSNGNSGGNGDDSSHAGSGSGDHSTPLGTGTGNGDRPEPEDPTTDPGAGTSHPGLPHGGPVHAHN